MTFTSLLDKKEHSGVTSFIFKLESSNSKQFKSILLIIDSERAHVDLYWLLSVWLSGDGDDIADLQQ